MIRRTLSGTVRVTKHQHAGSMLSIREVTMYRKVLQLLIVRESLALETFGAWVQAGYWWRGLLEQVRS